MKGGSPAGRWGGGPGGGPGGCCAWRRGGGPGGGPGGRNSLGWGWAAAAGGSGPWDVAMIPRGQLSGGVGCW